MTTITFGSASAVWSRTCQRETTRRRSSSKQGLPAPSLSLARRRSW